MGASIAFHLATLGADDVVLCDIGEIASGATSKAMGGIRQQFSTAPEVKLAQASIRFFEELGAPLFHQVGYLFLATTEDGLAHLHARAELQRGLGVPVEEVDAAEVRGLHTGDVLGAVICREDGVADPSATAHELVRRSAALGVDVQERADAREVDCDTLVIAAGWRTPEVTGIALPIRPLVRQLVDVGPCDGLPETLPMVVEEETGFHFRRRDACLRLAMREPTARWGSDERLDDGLVEDWRARLAQRYPSAAGAPVERAWAGLYDMTPDAHPIIGPIGEGMYVAAGFSGHGFMQSPAVGRGVAEELLGLSPSVDLTPYRLDRFDADAVFPEELVL